MVGAIVRAGELRRLDPGHFAHERRIRRRLAQRVDPWRGIDEDAGEPATAVEMLETLRKRAS